MNWCVCVVYGNGVFAVIKSFSNELDAYKHKKEVVKEYWVEKGDRIFVAYIED